MMPCSAGSAAGSVKPDRPVRARVPGPARTLVALGVLLAAAPGCGANEAASGNEPEEEGIPKVPVPAANGPKLVATEHQVAVYDRPSPKGKVIGWLRAGAQVSRAAEPYTRAHCPGGWYPIRPRGFVCVGQAASIDLGHAMAKILSEGPNLDRPMPYRYGRVRPGAAVLYGKLPGADEQLRAEPKLGGREDPDALRLGAGANDVPLDEHFVPKGLAVVQPDGDGVGPDGYRTVASYFMFDGPQTPPAPLAVGGSLLTGQAASDTRVLKHKSGVAVVGSFVVGEDKAARRFGVTPEGRFVPTDRLLEAMGTTWHGEDLRERGLPLAFALDRRGLHFYRLEKGNAEPLDEELEPRQPIALTGRFRTLQGMRYFVTAGEERWVRHKDIVLVAKRDKFPDFATPDQKWIDVSLANQTLVAWEGHKPVYATLVSAGQDRLGDPNTGASATLQGVFKLRAKRVTAPVDDREVQQAFTVGEAPWVLEYADGFAITAGFWSTHFGEATGFHNVSLAPIDAHWLWRWAEPELPEGWHGVMIEEGSESTVVYVHK